MKNKRGKGKRSLKNPHTCLTGITIRNQKSVSSFFLSFNTQRVLPWRTVSKDAPRVMTIAVASKHFWSFNPSARNFWALPPGYVFTYKWYPWTTEVLISSSCTPLWTPLATGRQTHPEERQLYWGIRAMSHTVQSIHPVSLCENKILSR